MEPNSQCQERCRRHIGPVVIQVFVVVRFRVLGFRALGSIALSGVSTPYRNNCGMLPFFFRLKSTQDLLHHCRIYSFGS